MKSLRSVSSYHELAAFRSRPSLWQVLRDVHHDDRGVVSLETVLILGAVAIPVLIVIVKFGWPEVKTFFDRGMNDLDKSTQRAIRTE